MTDSFFDEEERDGFLVTAKRKHIWGVELGLLEQFDAFCRRNGLRYYAGFGTLLGAVRHPDYERMEKLASEEFSYPYAFQPSNYSRELNLITPHAKLRDNRTSAVQFPEASIAMSQGICIDIFPLDSVGDGTGDGQIQFRLKLELYYALNHTANFLKDAAAGRTLIDIDTANELTSLTGEELFIIYEDQCLQNYEATNRIEFLPNYGLRPELGWNKEWFETYMTMPFEYLQIPVPAGYDRVLRSVYGDYMKRVMGTSQHEGVEMDPDNPYFTYLKNS